MVVVSVAAAVGIWRIADRRHEVRPLTVEDLLSHGASYDGKIVTVIGEVITGAALSTFGGYRLGDGMGHKEVVVLTDTGVPPLNDRVTVTGMYKQAVTFDNLRYGVIVPPGWCDDTKWRYLPGKILALLCKATSA